MDKKRLASRLMLVGGLVEILAGFLHFIWPFQWNETGEFANLSTDYKNLLFLVSVSLGLCLTVFGVLSIRFSKKLLIGGESAWVYGISQGILWEVRTILELMFPVKIPLLFVPNPTTVVLPVAFLLGLLFLVPLLMFKEEFVRC